MRQWVIFGWSRHQITTLAGEKQRWSISNQAIMDVQFVEKCDRAEDLQIRNVETSLADEWTASRNIGLPLNPLTLLAVRCLA